MSRKITKKICVHSRHSNRYYAFIRGQCTKQKYFFSSLNKEIILCSFPLSYLLFFFYSFFFLLLQWMRLLYCYLFAVQCSYSFRFSLSHFTFSPFFVSFLILFVYHNLCRVRFSPFLSLSFLLTICVWLTLMSTVNFILLFFLVSLWPDINFLSTTLYSSEFISSLNLFIPHFTYILAWSLPDYDKSWCII